MADPRAFDTIVGVHRDEALALLEGLLADVPEAQQSFAERHGNDYLPGSPATLAEASRNDFLIRQSHGLDIMISGLVRVVAAQQQQIVELKAAKPTKAAKATTKR